MAELRRIAERPTREEMLERPAMRAPTRLRTSVAEILRRERRAAEVGGLTPLIPLEENVPGDAELSGESHREGQRSQPWNAERVHDEVNDACPEVGGCGRADRRVRDTGRMRDEHQRGEHREILDRVVVRLLHARSPWRERLRILGITDSIGDATHGDRVENVRYPHESGEEAHPGEVHQFFSHDWLPQNSCAAAGNAALAGV